MRIKVEIWTVLHDEQKEIERKIWNLESLMFHDKKRWVK